MSEIENVIFEYREMCGEPARELCNLAQAELDDLRRFVQIGIEILEARDKGLSVACDALIDKKLRRLISDNA